MTREQRLERAVRLILALDQAHQAVEEIERVQLAPKTRQQLEEALAPTKIAATA